MGGGHSRSRDLVLKSAGGDAEGVRLLLGQYLMQRRNGVPAGTPPADIIDINFALPEGDFALQRAVTHQHDIVVKLLIEHGCDVNQQDHDGLTALMCAVHEPETDIARILIRQGHAELESRDTSGHTALHFAAMQGQAAHVRLLLDSRASVDATNDQGETPLLLASVRGRRAIAEMLLEEGADPRRASRAGHRPCDFLSAELLTQFLPPPIAARRCDEVIEVLYPFLTTAILEVVMDYDEQCYVASESMGLRRLVHYITQVHAEQDRYDAMRRQQLEVDAPEGSAVGSPSPISGSSSVRTGDAQSSLAPPSHSTMLASPSSSLNAASHHASVSSPGAALGSPSPDVFPSPAATSSSSTVPSALHVAIVDLQRQQRRGGGTTHTDAARAPLLEMQPVTVHLSDHRSLPIASSLSLAPSASASADHSETTDAKEDEETDETDDEEEGVEKEQDEEDEDDEKAHAEPSASLDAPSIAASGKY